EVELGSFHLEGFCLAGEFPVFKNERYGLRAIADVELSAVFLYWESFLQLRQDTHLGKDALIVGQERFADVKAREMILFENQNTLAGLGQECCCRTSSGAASDDDDVVNVVGHDGIKRDFLIRDKRRFCPCCRG